VADFSGHLRQLVEKMLIQRGRRRASCRVYAPAGVTRTYSVILEEAGVREQLFIEVSHVERFAESGNEQFVHSEIRNAVRDLDRKVTRKKTARER